MPSEMPKNTRPTPTAISATVRTTRSSSCASGLLGRRPACVIVAIAASRVFDPVASTAARPSPSTTNVPANICPSSSTATGSLSPVRSEASMRSACDRITRRSADTRSPAARITRSSTTSSAASISDGSPSRSTITPTREQILQAFRGVLGPGLLHEREHAVDHHDHEDRDAELRQLRDERQHAGDPQHQREEVRHLRRELPPRRWRLRARQRVAPVTGQPRRRVRPCEPAVAICHPAECSRAGSGRRDFRSVRGRVVPRRARVPERAEVRG